MIRNTSKNQLLMMVLAVGFFVGIIYENIVHSMHFFEKEKLSLLCEINFKTKEYLFHIVKMRVLTVIGFCWIGNFRWRKQFILLIGCWGSLFLGRSLVSAILTHGLNGILVCLAAYLPHMLFYTCVYLIILFHVYNDRRRKWRKIQIVAIVILFALGMCSEVYINPIILERIARRF